jgi:hypothetical protein
MRRMKEIDGVLVVVPATARFLVTLPWRGRVDRLSRAKAVGVG